MSYPTDGSISCELADTMWRPEVPAEVRREVSSPYAPNRDDEESLSEGDRSCDKSSATSSEDETRQEEEGNDGNVKSLGGIPS